jgi:hypothetical protein
MSSMIQTPPPSIQIGGGDPGAGPGAPSGPGAPGGDPIAAFKAALTKLSEDALDATKLAHDPIDKQMILKIAGEIHGIIAGHQKEEDSLMGGGPGAKMIRRATPPSGSNGPSGGSGGSY